MPKTDNPHVLRLYDSLVKHTDEQAAKKIVDCAPLSKSADINKKFTWAEIFALVYRMNLMIIQ